MSANLENSAVAIGMEKVTFHSNLKDNAKSIPAAIRLRSLHILASMFKILQARFQKYLNQELPDVQAGFTKRGTRDQIANICWIIEKAREFQKNIYYCFIDYIKAFDCVDHNKLENSSTWKYQTTLPASWEICMKVKKQQLEPDMGQQTGSKLGKEYVKDVYCHPAYLTSMH